MKKITLLGANGQVGSYLQKQLLGVYEVSSLNKQQLDLMNTESIYDVLAKTNADLIINAAAYTAVDAAEDDEENAYLINRDAVAKIAEFSQNNDVPFIHYSTDYVFPGDADSPYSELDKTQPRSVYGASKLAGEQAVLEASAPAVILRTSWVYSNVGKNFYNTMKRLAAERDELKVVADQVGAPTFAGSIAEGTKQLVSNIFEQGKLLESQKGVYHFTCGGQTSWHGFASELLSLNGFEHVKIHPIATSEFPTPAKRPAYSVLDNSKLAEVFSIHLPDWQQALKSCVDEIA